MRSSFAPFVIALFALSPSSPGQGKLFQFEGSSGETLGNAVADAGDVDLDGIPDFIVAAKLTLVAGVPAGAVYVHSGADGAVLHAFHGSTLGEWFGWSVSRAGDVNGDGHADVLVGAPHHDGTLIDTGAAFAYSGLDGALLYSWDGDGYGGWFGYSVADAGDVDMDGFPDVVGGAWRDSKNGPDSGTVRVFSGSDGALLHEWFGASPGDEFGFSVSGAGDTNLDGYDDVICAVLDLDDVVTDCGGARLLSGFDGSVLKTWLGDATADWFGYSVCRAGDVNGDGYADVVVGAPRDDNNGFDSGMIRVFSGFDHSVLLQVDGPYKSRFGWCVGDLDDLDGDGVPDFIVGMPEHVHSSGGAQIISGADGSTLRSMNPDDPSLYGYFVSRAGDVNRDGFDDVLIGAPFDDSASINGGAAFLISPTCGTAFGYGTGCAGTGGFVPDLAITGCPTPGGSIMFSLTSALGGSVAFLILGLGHDAVALGPGCPLLIGPTLPNVFNLPLSGSGPGGGILQFTDSITPAINTPVTVTMQVLVADPVGAGGYSSTNGVELFLP